MLCGLPGWCTYSKNAVVLRFHRYHDADAVLSCRGSTTTSRRSAVPFRVSISSQTTSSWIFSQRQRIHAVLCRTCPSALRQSAGLPCVEWCVFVTDAANAIDEPAGRCLLPAGTVTFSRVFCVVVSAWTSSCGFCPVRLLGHCQWAQCHAVYLHRCLCVLCRAICCMIGANPILESLGVYAQFCCGFFCDGSIYMDSARVHCCSRQEIDSAMNSLRRSRQRVERCWTSHTWSPVKARWCR